MSVLARLIPVVRGTGRLAPATPRDPIAAELVVVPPFPGSSAGGVVSPLTEQAYSGVDYYQLTSSDGLFVFEFPASTDYQDGAGAAIKVVHRDPDA